MYDKKIDRSDVAKKLKADHIQNSEHAGWLRRHHSPDTTVKFTEGILNEIKNLWEYFEFIELYGEIEVTKIFN